MLTAPAHGGRYLLNASVASQYSCTDNHSVASCTGPVANGQPIATSSTGGKQFVVTATDAGGNVATAQAFYKVFTPVSFTAAFTTAEQATLQTAAQGFGMPVDRAAHVRGPDPPRDPPTNFDPAPVRRRPRALDPS